jgi:hypothetical protein
MNTTFIRSVVCAACLSTIAFGQTATIAPSTQPLVPTKGMFAQFIGVCQANIDDTPIWNHISMNRVDMGWDAVEPTKGVWNDNVIKEFQTRLLDSRRKGVEMLYPLLYTAEHSARTEPWTFTALGKRYDVQAMDPAKPGERIAHVTNLLTQKREDDITLPAGRIPPDVAAWERYVEKVVSTFSKPPYNMKYFQPWNEAHDQFTGFWYGGMDEYMKTVHIPAAKIIHKYGGKVVFGGYPCCGSMQDYLNIIDRHKAWDTIDVLDIHYFPVHCWDYLYKHATKKNPNIAIWQTEVGFTPDKSWVPNSYPRFFYWAITHNWQPDRYKIFQFAYWAPDDPKAYGYRCNFMSGDKLNYHGKAFVTLAELLDAPIVKPYTFWKTKPSLTTEINEAKSSVEGFDCGDRIVLAIHLMDQNGAAMFTDWSDTGDVVHMDNPTSMLDVHLPKIDLADIKNIFRVSTYGTRIPMTAVAMGPKAQPHGVKISVPIMDAASKDTERQDSRDAKYNHFYLLVELKK